MAFAMAAEIERDLISQRTKEALRARKASGMALGRPRGPGKSKLDAFRPEIEALLANGSTQKFIAVRYRTTEANLHNWLKKHNIRKVYS
jgi:DNA invertase Pin-like site-specific DNA recombinase